MAHVRCFVRIGILSCLVVSTRATACICVGPSPQFSLDYYQVAGLVKVLSRNQVLVTQTLLGDVRVGEVIELIRERERDTLELDRDCCEFESACADVDGEYVLATDRIPRTSDHQRSTRDYHLLRLSSRQGDFLSRLHTETPIAIEERLQAWGRGAMSSREFAEWIDTAVLEEPACSTGYFRAFLAEMAAESRNIPESDCDATAAARLRSDIASMALNTFRALVRNETRCSACYGVPDWLPMPLGASNAAVDALSPCSRPRASSNSRH
jgi:hypothetical protein